MASRAAERARIAPPFQASDDLDPKHIKFMQSSQSRGVKINAVAPSRLPGRGLGIVATSKIKRGTSVLFVPEKAMFKPDREFLRQNNLSSASPQAQLAISVMAACLASGPEDEMAIWDATWPTDDDFQHSLPFRWPEAWHALLPAGAQQPLRRQIRDWEVDLAAVGPVLELNKWQEGDFLYYWCIVNSRSFHWKPSGGRNRGGKGKNGPLVKGEMVMCPFIDYLNHGPSGTTCEVFEREGGYEVIADRDYEPGEELLATYGAHSNDKLLVHYGFILPSREPSNPPESMPPYYPTDDLLPLTHYILPYLSDRTQASLSDVGYLGGYSLSPATNEICFKTQVAVRAELLSANEWEYFMSCGEDLAGDKEAEVRRWLVRIFDGCVKEATAMRIRLETDGRPGNGAMPGDGSEERRLLIARWKQIEEALSTFMRQA